MKKRKPNVILPIGMLISNIGNGMYTLAIGIILYGHTGKTSSFAFIVVLQAFLSFLTQSFASVISDKGFAQISAIWAELFRGTIIITCGALPYFVDVNFLILAATLLSLLQPFYRTSIFVLGPMIADGAELAKYNSRVSAFQQIGQLIGAGIAGVIIGFSPYLAIFLNGVSYLVSSYTMFISKIEHQDKNTNRFLKSLHLLKFKNVLYDWKALVMHLFERKLILYLAILGVTDVVIANYVNILYAPLLNHFRLSDYWLSIWDAMFAIGAILGVEWFGRARKFHGNIILSIIGLAIQLVCFLSIICIDMYHLVSVMFILGVGNSISSSSFNLTLQTEAKKEFLGRISGVRQMSISLATTFLIPFLSSNLNKSVNLGNITMSLIIGGVILLSFILLNVFLRMGERRDAS